jgi:hypothetical protein
MNHYAGRSGTPPHRFQCVLAEGDISQTTASRSSRISRRNSPGMVLISWHLKRRPYGLPSTPTLARITARRGTGNGHAGSSGQRAAQRVESGR